MINKFNNLLLRFNVFLGTSLLPVLAYADEADDIVKNLEPVQNTMNKFTIYFIGIIGIIVLIWVGFEFVKLMRDKQTLFEFFGVALKIVAGGFAIIIASLIWSWITGKVNL